MKVTRLLMMAIIGGIILSSCKPRTPEPSARAGDSAGYPGATGGENRLVKLYYENSGGEKAVTRFYYDLQGNNYLAVWHLDDSSRSSVNYHTLDSAGRLIVKSRDFSDGITSLQHFQYDKRGNLLKEDFSRSDGVTGEAEYFYGPDGRLEASVCRRLNGWFHGRIEYTWEEGVKTGAVLVHDSIPIGSIRYGYENGRLVRERWDFNGSWNQVFIYEYQDAARQTFASSNVFIRENPWFRIGSEYYDYNGESGGPSYYAYDASGKLLSKEFVRSDGLRTIATYDYDSTGLLDASRREYGDGRIAEFLYWYSIDRKLLVKTFRWSDGSSGSETYRYENGMLTRGEYVNVDGWLNGTLDFNYDEKRILRSAEFTGQNGFDAAVGFTYDRDFNLVRIHWELSTGQSQTYEFEYRPGV
jgi:hypothetical protein